MARFHGLGVSDLTGPLQTQAVVGPRYEAVALIREATQEPFAAIGRLFGGRDTATIQSGLARFLKRVTTDPEYRAAFERVKIYVAHCLSAETPARVDAAQLLARRVLAGSAKDADARAVATTLLMAASVLRSPDLTDAEARAAAVTIIANAGGPADAR